MFSPAPRVAALDRFFTDWGDMRFGLLFALVLLAAPVWAQERVVLPNGVTCEVTRPAKDDTRTECADGGSYGIRDNQDGTRDELKLERSILRLGRKTWKATRVKKERMVPERDPLPAIDVNGAPLPVVALDVPPASALDVVHVIDINCVWTASTQAAHGGAPNMAAFCATIKAVGDETYRNSGSPNVTLRVVGVKMISYLESSGINPLSWMVHFCPVGLPCYPNLEISSYATATGADRTLMIGNGVPNLCGVAYLFPGTYAYCERGCCLGNLTAIHELGHTFGFHHRPGDSVDTPNCDVIGDNVYNCGHMISGGRGCLMTYNAIRARLVSNPLVLYPGTLEPSGTVNRDNARVLRNNAAAIAATRAPVGAPLPSRKPSRPTRTRVEPRP